MNKNCLVHKKMLDDVQKIASATIFYKGVSKLEDIQNLVDQYEKHKCDKNCNRD